jgi:multiple sugar transport system substrate-binding protein
LQVGIPAASSMVFLLYNVDWAKELGFSRAPITPDEFRQQACAAAKANRLAVDETLHGTGGWLVNTDALSMLGWASAFGGSLEPDENGSYQFNTSQIKYAFTYLNNLYTAGCAWNGRSDTPFAYFASRHALFTTSSLEDLAEQISVMGRMNSTDRWTVLPFPSTSDKPVVVSYGSDYYLVQSTAERQLAAWLFLRWISSPEQDVRFVRGTGIYPARLSSLDSLGDYLRDHSQWSAAVALLSGALPSPTYSSWQVARAIIQDGAGQLFQTDTQPEQVGQILQQMDALAAEVMKVSP